ncbi:MAG: hypothetical protein AAGB34_05290 [Planctomycetota bacterium]
MPALAPLIISAPFGNYIQPTGTTPTLGTFTMARRRGRLWRTIRTVRYDPFSKAWINKIGLRNPGIASVESKPDNADLHDKVISIHGFNENEWAELVHRAAALAPLAIELNISCPNVGELSWPPDLFERAVSTGVRAIVKIPPVRFRPMVEAALNAGVRTLHCCNTLPVPAGGMSGKPLKPVALECINHIRSHHDTDNLIIVGGGGITTPADIDDYANAGANHFAIATKCFNPILLVSHASLKPLIEHAARKAINAE